MSESEIDAIRNLLSSKPRPVGWEERRQRIEEVGATWPEADDIKTTAVDVDGRRGEWTIAPGGDQPQIAQAQAAVDKARLDLARTNRRAPMDGGG